MVQVVHVHAQADDDQKGEKHHGRPLLVSDTIAGTMQTINISDLQKLLQASQAGAGTASIAMPTAVTPAADPGTAALKAYMQTLSDSSFGPGHAAAWDTLINNESGWNPTAQNPNSTAYGLGQFLDSTWAGAGVKKTSDPMQQLNAMATYIKQRYGNPTNALDFWENQAPQMAVGSGSHWY